MADDEGAMTSGGQGYREEDEEETRLPPLPKVGGKASGGGGKKKGGRGRTRTSSDASNLSAENLDDM